MCLPSFDARRTTHDADLYLKILGAANEFTEGDAIVGVVASDDRSRKNARILLAHTLLADIDAHPFHQALNLLTGSAATRAFDIAQEDPATVTDAIAEDSSCCWRDGWWNPESTW